MERKEMLGKSKWQPLYWFRFDTVTHIISQRQTVRHQCLVEVGQIQILWLPSSLIQVNGNKIPFWRFISKQLSQLINYEAKWLSKTLPIYIYIFIHNQIIFPFFSGVCLKTKYCFFLCDSYNCKQEHKKAIKNHIESVF